MKSITKITILLIFLSFSVAGFAQKPIKLGHINSDELLKKLPEKDTVEAKLAKYYKELEATLKSMQTEFENRYKDFTEKSAQMSELIKQTKAQELQDMQSRYEEFQQNAQKEFQQKRSEMYEPLINKLKKAIEEVAKENKYTYVFDSSVGVLLYSEDSEDIMPMVKKKLNLK